MNLTFAAQLNKMITAGLGGAVEAPETGVAVGRRVEYTSIGPAPILTFEANLELPLKALSVSMEPIQEGSGDPSPENIRPISGRSTVNIWREATYDTSAEPILTIPLGQTVYGGTVDVTTGEMVVNRAMVDLGTLEWREIEPFIYRTVISNILPAVSPPYENRQRGAVCSTYAPDNQYSVSSTAMTDKRWLRIEKEFFIRDTSYADVTAFKTAMNGVQLVYELAQPITITLTPEQLTTVLGQNNVWSDGGDVSLTYGTVKYTEGY